MTTPSSSLSQSYFDETVVENQDVFELEPEAAVTETIDQLFKQQQTTSKLSLQRWKDLQRQQGVSLTHPDSPQGKLDRQRQKSLQGLLDPEEWTEVEQLLDLLKQDDALPVGNLFWQNQSFSKLAQFSLTSNDNLALALRVALQALAAPPKSSRRSRQEQIQKDFILPSQGWERLFGTDNNNSQECQTQTLWLQLIYQVCQGHEPNKKYNNSKRILQTLVNTLQQQLNQEPSNKELVETTCRVLTVLCRFDDFSSQATQGQATDNTGMVVSSAHSTVTTLGTMNVIPVLQAWLVKATKDDDDETLLLALLQCLRSLAIQDEMVTRMVSAGNMLEELQSIFQTYAADNPNDDNDNEIRLDILTALIGLYRNLSANDDLKTILCRSPTQSIVGPLIATLQNLPTTNNNNTTTKLQEHVCATLGSMALRQPQNAQRIVQDYQGHVVILQAMQSSQSPLVQRQGALAIRNLASRSTDPMKQAMLDAGAEPVLRQAATLGAVDEAYAALRDLGIHAVVLHSNPETGQLERQAMFGEKPLQFRPVFD